ncbi:MAG TPA: hypothetical protein VNX28_05155 [Gemmataceae bacterium]|nr:hypothetical protein [Gemmataceae bacterium]
MATQQLFQRLVIGALVIAWAGAAAPAQDQKNPEGSKKLPEVTKEHLASKVPNFFYFDYTGEPQPGKRLWLRIDDKHFVERYPDGIESKFKIIGRATVDGVQGTALVKIAGDAQATGTENDGSLQVFLPDRGSAKMEFRVRFVPAGDQWGNLGEMKKVE